MLFLRESVLVTFRSHSDVLNLTISLRLQTVGVHSYRQFVLRVEYDIHDAVLRESVILNENDYIKPCDVSLLLQTIRDRCYWQFKRVSYLKVMTIRSQRLLDLAISHLYCMQLSAITVIGNSSAEFML